MRKPSGVYFLMVDTDLNQPQQLKGSMHNIGEGYTVRAGGGLHPKQGIGVDDQTGIRDHLPYPDKKYLNKDRVRVESASVSIVCKTAVRLLDPVPP